jgi:glucose-1-phosphate cytidylyltransferase
MKVVILAGGLGTRISEESHLKPKPMIEIGGRPILWHIIKSYSHYGFNDFIICAGYKQHVIKEYFADYFLHMSDVTFNLKTNEMIVHDNYAEPWKVTVVDTGMNTMTGGRVKRIRRYVEDEPFMLTYGDAVSNVNITDLLAFHKEHGKMVTLTAVQPSGRFGILSINQNHTIKEFREKHKEDGGWINAGFMVLQPEIFDLIEGDATTFEREPLERAASSGNLKGYLHNGFWQCMDTLREKEMLDELYTKGNAPWKNWEDR